MNKLVNLIFYVSFLFWGGGFLIAFGQFVAYNGLGNFFEYRKVDRLLHIEGDTVSKPAKLKYVYLIGDKRYEDDQNVSRETAGSGGLDTLTVTYNTLFPNLTVVEELHGKASRTWDQFVGMMVFGIPFLFFMLIYFCTDREKWIGVYSRGEFKSSKKS